MKQIDWIPPHRNKPRWYQRQYRGPYWLLAVLIVSVWAGLVTLVEELAPGPAATISVEEVAEAPHSPQESRTDPN